MKFKEIKPGMVIHCPKEEDARALLEYLDGMGYRWGVTGKRLTENTCYKIYGDRTCYKVENDKNILYGYSPLEKGITEFSDLIESDENLTNQNNEMSTLELLEWLRKAETKEFEKLFSVGDIEEMFDYHTNDEIIRIITAYEAAKKAPKPVEVEWVDICRIIQIQPNGFKKCVYEEDLRPWIEWGKSETMEHQTEIILKKYISEHDGKYFATVECICRVKEDK